MFKSRTQLRFKIRKKFKENDLRMNSQKIEASTNYSNMMRLIEGLSKQVEELTLQCIRASIAHMDDLYVMIRDAARAAQEDADDDVDADKDPQPLEFRGPPRDP
ncbi:hypothetical protein Tco_1230011 [Tanacetum coccineum]